MTFKTIKTGSAGNAFLVDNILIDCGASWSILKDEIEGVTHILLTHEHSDHFRTDTIRKLVVNREDIKIVCGLWMVEKLLKSGVEYDRIIEVEVGKVYEIGEFKISPILAYHDVENCGYRLMKNGHKHLHITDTSTLYGISAYGYDTASIECNHHRSTAMKLIEQAKEDGKFTHLSGAINSHLSVEEVISFCKKNKIKKLYPVHIGNITKKEVIQALKEWK